MKKIGFNEHYGLQTAVFNGTKTKTRRIEKCLDKLYAAEKELGEPLEIHQQEITREGIVLRTNAGILSLHTRYKIDEEVAVAQQYRDLAWDSRLYKKIKLLCPGEMPWNVLKGWDNKMFVKADLMPHQIRITGIKVERLQDISDEDCLKEGICRWKDMEDFPKSLSEIQRNRFGYYGVWDAFSTPQKAFAALIERPGIGHKGDWNKNPWEIVYTFKLIK